MDVAMDKQGWVKNWRKIEDWEWYKTPYMAHLFQHLIRRGNHQGKRWQGIAIERGQIITSLQSLKSQTGISTQSLRTCLKRLESTGEIAQKSTNRYRLITICHYDTYQTDQQATNNQPTSNQQATNKQLTTNKNVKNEKNDNNEKKERAHSPKKHFVKPSVEQVRLYAKSIGYIFDAGRFIDYYESNGWMVGRTHMKDWKAAVRTWKGRDAPKVDTRNFDMTNLPRT